MKYCIINNKLIPSGKAFISIDERGFLFGDGIFETCRFDNQKIYNFEAHFNRLKAGLDSIKIDFAKLPQFSGNSLENEIQQLISKNNLQNGLVRIYVSRGQGSFGYAPKANISPLIIIQTKDLPQKPEKPVDLWISKISKISAKSLPVNYKLAQGLNSTLAKLEAQEKNCFDSILLNDLDQICETSSANIFWIKDKILYTPAPNCGILLGTIRQKIIDLSPIEIQEVSANLEELLQAQEIFISNISYGILPVGRILPHNKILKNQKYCDIFNKLIAPLFS